MLDRLASQSRVRRCDLTKDSPYKKFAKDVGIIGIARALVAIGSLHGIILLPILTKNLTTAEYGVFVQLSVLIALLTPIATLSLPYAMVRYISGEKDKREIQEAVISTSIFVFLVSIILATSIITLSETVFHEYLGEAKDLVKIVALIIPFWCTSQVFLNVFRAYQEVKHYSTFLFFQTYGEVVLIAYFVLSGYGIFGAMFAVFIVRTILLLVVGYLAIEKVGVKKPEFTRLRGYLSFGLPLVPVALSYWVVSASDRYIIGYFLGATHVGFYNPGYTLGSAIRLLLGPLVFVLPAVLTQQFEENRTKEVQNILRYSLKYFLLVAIPAVFGLTFLSKQFLTLLSTEEIAINAYVVVPFAAMAMLSFGVYVIFGQILFLEKKTKIYGPIWFICAALNIAFNIILVPLIGILGAAISTLVTYALSTILIGYYALKFFKFEVDTVFILKSIFSSTVISLAIVILNPTGILHVLGTIGVCIIIYSLILLLTKGFKKEEIKFFKELLKI